LGPRGAEMGVLSNRSTPTLSCIRNTFWWVRARDEWVVLTSENVGARQFGSLDSRECERKSGLVGKPAGELGVVFPYLVPTKLDAIRY
jgi:hypothetical protein